jgi:hypothetical protein
MSSLPYYTPLMTGCSYRAPGSRQAVVTLQSPRVVTQLRSRRLLRVIAAATCGSRARARAAAVQPQTNSTAIPAAGVEQELALWAAQMGANLGIVPGHLGCGLGAAWVRTWAPGDCAADAPVLWQASVSGISFHATSTPPRALSPQQRCPHATTYCLLMETAKLEHCRLHA